MLSFMFVCSKAREAELQTEEEGIADINKGMQHFHEINRQTVEDTLGEIDKMVCLSISERISKNDHYMVGELRYQKVQF